MSIKRHFLPNMYEKVFRDALDETFLILGVVYKHFQMSYSYQNNQYLCQLKALVSDLAPTARTSQIACFSEKKNKYLSGQIKQKSSVEITNF